MAKGLILHPTRSLVSNIGFDGSGTHCGNGNVDNFVYNQSIGSFPKEIKIDNLFLESIASYLRLSSNSNQMRSSISRLLARLRQKTSVLIQAFN
jgi:hypothetical protein